MGPYSVRMKRTGSRKLSKCLPDPWDPIKIKKIRKIPGNPGNPGKSPDRVLALRRKQVVGSIDLDPSIPPGLDSWILGVDLKDC